MGKFKKMAVGLDELNEMENKMDNRQVIAYLKSIQSTGFLVDKFTDNIKRKTAALEKAIKIIKEKENNDRNYTVYMACLIIFFIISISILFIKYNFYKNELYKTVELRQNDLKTIEYYINENNSLKKQLQEMIQ